MTSPNPLSEKDVIVEGVKQIGETLRSIVSKLSGQYVLIFGVSLLIIAAATGSYIATLESPAYEILWLPYVLLGTGIVIIILWLIGNKINKSFTVSHPINLSSEKFGKSLRKRLQFLDEITMIVTLTNYNKHPKNLLSLLRVCHQTESFMLNKLKN